MSFTNKWENEVLNYLFGNAPMTIPASLYLGLHVGSVAATDDGAGFIEPTGGAYARVQLPRNTTIFPTTTTGEIKNAVELVFPDPTALWGTVSQWGLFDAVTGGSAVIIASLQVAKVVTVGDKPTFGINALSIRLT